MEKAFEMDEKSAGFAVIAVMIASFIWMVVTGINGGNLIPVLLFSASLSVAMLFFGQWFQGKD